MNSFDRAKKVQKMSKGRRIEQLLALLLSVLCLPIHLINYLVAFINHQPTFIEKRKIDALGRTVVLKNFRYGLIKKSAVIIDVLLGNLSFVGVSMNHTLTREQQKLILTKFNILPGTISLYDVHQSIGLDHLSPWQLLNKQLNGGLFSHMALLIKGAIGLFLYQSKNLTTPKIANLFELPINNVSMSQAVDWSIHGSSLIKPNLNYQSPQLGFFINAHSVNLAESDALFKSSLRHANVLFADGSGMRVAAKSIGIKLQSNINGTDMLPRICRQAELQDKSIFLLGGQPDRAIKAAKALKTQFPQLQIAGTHHGFFNFKDEAKNQEIIKYINASKADIVLVGLGSPNQEYWCQQHINSLQCTSVLAVGGLFDYFSGAIPRAPLMFRELGLEWVWRLWQEPLVKFKRYVVGTPEFLVRTFILKQV